MSQWLYFFPKRFRLSKVGIVMAIGLLTIASSQVLAVRDYKPMPEKTLEQKQVDTKAWSLDERYKDHKIDNRINYKKVTPTPTLPSSFPLTPTPAPTFPPTPTPRTIPQGMKGFSISSGRKDGPQMYRGFIDPYDPKAGENQTLSIKVQDSTSVQSVSVTMKTDNGSKEYPTKLVEGTLTNGRWEATWVVEDTHLYTYHSILQATGETGTSSVDITLR